MKKLLSVCLAIALVAVSITITPVKAEDYKCGENITWTWDGKTHTLTLTGTGAMYNYNPGTSHPYMPTWAGYDIQNLYIGEGITSIGDFAFQNKTNIYGINLPSTIQTIGQQAFRGVKNVSYLNFPYGVREIGSLAFAECGTSSGMIVNLPATLSTINALSFYDANIHEMNYCAGTYLTSVKNALNNAASGSTTTVNTDHSYAAETVLATFGVDGYKGASVCSRCKTADPEHTGEVIPMLMDPIVSPVSAVYDGNPHVPTVAVFNSDNKLCSPTIINHHDAQFIDAGTYTISLNYAGSSLYSGRKDIEYVIKPAEKAIEIALDSTEFTYTGEVQKPVVTVISDGSELSESEYTVDMPESADVGQYEVKVSLTGNYKGDASATYTISKAKQTPKIKAKAKTVKYSKVKKKKQVVKKAITVKKSIGKISYKKVKKGSSKKLSINKKNGKITVKKGTKKGTYKIKVKVTAAGDNNYKKYSKTVTVKVKVK